MANQIIGYDHGNCNLKTSSGWIVPAKVKTEENIFNSENEIIFNDKKYIIGEGEYDTEYDKTQKENFLPCLCAALGNSVVDQGPIDLVVGLPIEQYKKKKDELKEIIDSNKILEFKLNNNFRRIMIDKVLVYPESAATFYVLDKEFQDRFKNKDIIIIDIGGRTTDISLLEKGRIRKIIKVTSLDVGMINIYTDLKNYINSNFSTTIKIEQSQDILDYGLEIDGKIQDLSEAKEILKKNFLKIVKELNINYPTKTSPIFVTGGGGKYMFNSLNKKFPNSFLIKDYLFSNAKGFKKVGELNWQIDYQ